MRILITGATGFIGAHLAKHLAKQHEIAMLLRPQARKERLAGIEPPPRLLLWDGTVESMPLLLNDFKPACVIHLASYFTGAHKPADIDPLIESNIRFPSILLETMAQSGCKQFINTGSVMQHYENAAYAPMNLYAATKQACADILTYYIQSSGIKRAVTLELADTYGPNDPRSKLISLLQKTAASGEVLGMSPGEQYVDLIHVDDVVRAYELALGILQKMPDGQQKTFAIRSGAPLTVKSLVELFNQVSPRPVKAEWGKRPYQPREIFQPWQGELLPGWKPQITLQEGLRALLGAKS